MVNTLGSSEVSVIITAKDQFSKTLKNARTQLRDLSKGLIAVGAVAAAGLGLAIKTAIDFESAFTGVRKTVELSEKEFGDLEQRFKDLSTTIPVSFVELSKIGELAGQLGVTGVDDITKFTDTIARIAVTTNLTSEEAATGFARISNIMQEPIQNVDRLGSVVVELGNNFATTEREIVDFATRIAAAGKTVGLTTPEIFGIATAFTSVGVRSELGGSAIIRVLNDMNKAVLTSDDNLALFAKTAGFSIEEFEQLFRRDASEAFTSFVEGLTKDGNVAAQVLDDLGLGGVRIVQALTSASQAEGILSDAIATANQEFEDNNALIKESENRFQDLGKQLDIVKNRLLLIADAVGKNLAEDISAALEEGGALDRLLSFFEDMSEPQLDFIANLLKIGGVALAVGVVIFALGTGIGEIALVLALVGGAIATFITILQNWEFVQAKVIRSSLIAWNLWVNGMEASINFVIRRVLEFIKLINLIPGIDISTPQIDLQGFKRVVPGLDELVAKQSLAAELPSAFTPIPNADLLTTFGGQKQTIEVVVQLDGIEISRSQQNQLGERVTT